MRERAFKFKRISDPDVALGTTEVRVHITGPSFALTVDASVFDSEFMDDLVLAVSKLLPHWKENWPAVDRVVRRRLDRRMHQMDAMLDRMAGLDERGLLAK